MTWLKSKTHWCVQGSTNGTNGIPKSFNVLPMVPLVIPLVMQMVPLALTIAPLVSRWYHWLPMVPLGEPRTEPLSMMHIQNYSYIQVP